MNKVRIALFLAIGLFLTQCSQPVMDSGTESDLSNRTSLLVSGSTDLVDIRVRKLTRYLKASRPDHMSRIVDTTIAGYANEGGMWYILPTNSPYGGHNIYRMLRNGNHMTSRVACTVGSTGESGYLCEEWLGKLIGINDPAVGLYPVNRFYWTNGSIINHLDARLGEAPLGYVNEGAMGFAFPTASQALHTEQARMDLVNAHGITMGTSFAWGGSIVSIKKNGVDYVNRYDAGREVQSALHMYGVNRDTDDNPTEAGDVWGNGSAIINYDLNLGGIAGRVHTRANALRWGKPTSPGRDVLAPTKISPIISGTEIGKDSRIINSTQIRHDSWFVYGKSFTAPGGFPLIEEEVVAWLNNLFNQMEIREWNTASSSFVSRASKSA